ncbi:MAG TPA: SRPBCC family protein [Thermoleophilaceae bacterium]|nr:SRPBCC family protein [Thermoleophilaceae bacterium]
MTYPTRADRDAIFETAPMVIPVTVELDASPAQVWDALGSDQMWSWFPPLDRLRWLTGRPLQEGAVRTIRVARLFTLEEHFYRWEEGRRATFHVVGVTRPVLDALAEDFLLEPTAGGGTRLTWTFAVDPKLPGARLVASLLGPLLKAGNRFAIGGIRKILPRG